MEARAISDAPINQVKPLKSRQCSCYLGERALPDYGQKLKDVLLSKNLWHRFIEFSEPVKTVEQACRKVAVEKIVKSIVMIDSDGAPLLGIVKAQSMVSFRKIKQQLEVKDVRLATPEEVLKQSGFPAGGVPPLNSINRVLLDPDILNSETCIAGGGDVNKLVEMKTKDVVEALRPRIVDIRDDKSRLRP
jgi:Cys-tRNA(Pro)/Cys-tRNA(Cys) deacylase